MWNDSASVGFNLQLRMTFLRERPLSRSTSAHSHSAPSTRQSESGDVFCKDCHDLAHLVTWYSSYPYHRKAGAFRSVEKNAQV